MKILILILSLNLVSCQPNQPSSTKSKPLFTLDAYYEDYNLENVEKNRSELLHAIYLSKTEKSKSEKTLEGLGHTDHESLDHLKNFAKLVVVYPKYLQIFYVPTDLDSKWLFENLNLERKSKQKFVWINKSLNIGKATFLIATDVEDILLNEKKFQTNTIKLNRVDQYVLSNLTKYQTIKVNVNSEISEPNREWATSTVGMGRHCDNGNDSKFGVNCNCDYKIERPTLNYENFIHLDGAALTFSLSINNSDPQDQKLSNFILDLRNEDEKVEARLDFIKSIEYAQNIKGVALNDQCVREPIEKQIFSKKIMYSGTIEIIGTKKTLKEFGSIPTEI